LRFFEGVGVGVLKLEESESEVLNIEESESELLCTGSTALLYSAVFRGRFTDLSPAPLFVKQACANDIRKPVFEQKLDTQERYGEGVHFVTRKANACNKIRVICIHFSKEPP
jgi:hypothetical protein